MGSSGKIQEQFEHIARGITTSTGLIPAETANQIIGTVSTDGTDAAGRKLHSAMVRIHTKATTIKIEGEPDIMF